MDGEKKRMRDVSDDWMEGTQRDFPPRMVKFMVQWVRLEEMCKEELTPLEAATALTSSSVSEASSSSSEDSSSCESSTNSSDSESE